jgi:hypothetical protein
MGKWLDRAIKKEELQGTKYIYSSKSRTDQTDKTPHQTQFAPETAKGGLNKTNPIHLAEATYLYENRGWIQVFSGYLKQSIYLMENKWIKVPDPSLPKYTRHEIAALNGLNWEEIQTLHEAKLLFKGEIL